MALTFYMRCVQLSVIVLKAIWQSLRTGPTLPSALTLLLAVWMTWPKVLYLSSLSFFICKMRIIISFPSGLL